MLARRGTIHPASRPAAAELQTFYGPVLKWPTGGKCCPASFKAYSSICRGPAASLPPPSRPVSYLWRGWQHGKLLLSLFLLYRECQTTAWNTSLSKILNAVKHCLQVCLPSPLLVASRHGSNSKRQFLERPLFIRITQSSFVEGARLGAGSGAKSRIYIDTTSLHLILEM